MNCFEVSLTCITFAEKRIMAKPIKDTPLLTGKDAERFRWHLEHPSPISKKRREEAIKIYEILKTNNPDCELFK